VPVSAGTIVVKGLDETVRGFRRLDSGLDKEIKSEFKSIANVVVDTAREIARAKDLRDSGELIRKIKPSVRGARAFVRATATRRNFPYPAVYEFGRRDNRPFLEPAVERERDTVIRRLENMLERMTSAEGF